VPGATVRVINQATGTVIESLSDAQGAYRAEGLAPGQYRVETALDGFETAVNQAALAAGQTLEVDGVLALSRFSQSWW
jgi:hypothetical protein